MEGGGGGEEVDLREARHILARARSYTTRSLTHDALSRTQRALSLARAPHELHAIARTSSLINTRTSSLARSLMLPLMPSLAHIARSLTRARSRTARSLTPARSLTAR